MTLSQAAADRFEAVRQDLFDRGKAAAHMLRSLIGKTPGTFLRLSGLLELMERGCGGTDHQPATISVENIERVACLIDYYIEMAGRVYGEAGMTTAEKNAIAIAREIHRRGAKKVNARVIRTESWVSGLRKAADVDAALQHLEAEDWLLNNPERAGDTKGRKRKDYVVNPRVYRSDNSKSFNSNGT